MKKKQPADHQPKRLYECEECHERRFVHWTELNRAATPKCHGCGSSHLQLVSSKAKNDMMDLQSTIVDASSDSSSLYGSLAVSKTRNRQFRV